VSSEFFEPSRHCDNGDWIDYAKYNLSGTYGQTRAKANDAIIECANYLRGQFDRGIQAADGLVDAKGKINVVATKVDFPCTFIGSINDRAKCNVYDAFGRALHGIQDFYSHSNWVDSPNPQAPISLTNPPGLQMSGVAPFLNLRSAANAQMLPPELATGCYELLCLGRAITHEVLTKDNGIIQQTPLVTLPTTGLTTNPTTPRGRIGNNFELAVTTAILDTRRQWKDFRDALIQTYGQTRGKAMICALTRDKPWEDCNGRAFAVVIDSSGSNQDTDPSNLRITAGQQFVASLVSANDDTAKRPADRVAVIDFDDSARVVYPMGDPASVSFAGIDSYGGTSIANGVTLGITTITDAVDPGAVKDKSGIVILTDGQDANTGALVAAVGQAESLGIRVAMGFLSPPTIAVNKRRSIFGLFRRQSNNSPLGGVYLDVVAAILKTGGTVAVISSADAQQRFVEGVIAHGATNSDSPTSGAAGGGSLFPNITAVAMASTSADTWTYNSAGAQMLNFTVSLVTNGSVTLDVKLRDAGNGQEQGTGTVTTGSPAIISYQAPANATLQLVVTPSGGNNSTLYSVRVDETTVTDTAPPAMCKEVDQQCRWRGKAKCCGTGMVVCHHHKWIYQPCAGKKVCKPKWSLWPCCADP
jgi:hypothetical protein